MGRHAALFGSEGVEIGCYPGTWIHYPSPPHTIPKECKPVSQFRYIGVQKVTGRALAPEFSVLVASLSSSIAFSLIPFHHDTQCKIPPRVLAPFRTTMPSDRWT